MSGLLERIVRRRRASANGPFDPTSGNGNPDASSYVNGASPAARIVDVLNPATDASAQAPPEAERDREGEEPVTTEFASADVERPQPAAREAASQPAPPQSASQPVPPPPEAAFKQRGRIRRRARYLRQLREVQLRDIGGFMLELHRFGRKRPDLVAAKVQGAAAVDGELRALEHALGHEPALRELREAGIGGACASCGIVHGSADRYCAACGQPLDAVVHTAGEPQEPPPADA